MNIRSKILVDNVVCQLSHWKHHARFRELRENTGAYSLEGFDRLKCIFVHIPKAAGVSINKALFDSFGGGHNNVRQYKRIFGPLVFNRYFKFTFVRNPYSRLFSAYHFLKSGGFDERDSAWGAENLSPYATFDDFVKGWVNEESIWTWFHFMPQYSFVCDIGTEPEVDFVGRIESINDDFAKICEILDVPNKLSVHNEGRSRKGNWRDHYSRYSLDKVADIYARDFETFAYSRE